MSIIRLFLWIRHSASAFWRIYLEKGIPFFLQALSQQLSIFDDILQFFLSLNDNLLSHFICEGAAWAEGASITVAWSFYPSILSSCKIFRGVKIWFFRSSLNLIDGLGLLVLVRRVFLHLHQQLWCPMMLCKALILW